MTDEERILRKRVCKDCIWEEMQHLVNTPMEQVYKAMNEYSDIMVGRAIAGRTSVSNVYEIPQHILDEYTDNKMSITYNQAIDDAIYKISQINSDEYEDGGFNIYDRLIQSIESQLQSLKK